MLEKLRLALEKALKRMSELNALCVSEKGEIRSFSDTEKTEYSALESSVKETQDAIKRFQDLEVSNKVLSTLDEPESRGRDPKIQVTREANCNEQGEYRGYGEYAKGGFGEFLRDVASAARGNGDTKKYKELREWCTRAATGANENIGSQGGTLVQSDHAEMLFSNAVGKAGLASRCQQVPMSSNSTTFLMVDESSLAIGSQFGGVQAYWRAEAATVQQTKPKFREVNVKAEALEALFYATNEQLEDAPQLGAFADLAFKTAMAFQLDDAVIAGNGAGKPLGILNSPCTITIAIEGGQATGTLVSANADKMNDRLLTGTESAIYVIHPDNAQLMRSFYLKPGTLTEFPVYIPPGGFSGKPYGQLFGRDVVPHQVARAKGIKGDFMLLDLSQYVLFVKKGVTASQSAHVAFLTGEQVFKWTLRANGMPLYNKPITDANGSTTRSPFIVLAARP